MKKITPERLKNSALYYLERYEASAWKLRDVLKRRLAKARLDQPVPSEAPAWIEEIIAEMCRLGYVNDKRFAENTVRRLTNAGKSPSFIQAKLRQAGVSEEEIQWALSETDELTSARLMVQKKHLGQDYNRDLARLARAGFSYDIAKEALEEVIKEPEL